MSLDRLVVGGWGLAAVPAGDRRILATEMIRLGYDIVMVVDASEELLGALVAKAAWVATLIRHALPGQHDSPIVWLFLVLHHITIEILIRRFPCRVYHIFSLKTVHLILRGYLQVTATLVRCSSPLRRLINAVDSVAADWVWVGADWLTHGRRGHGLDRVELTARKALFRLR